MGQRVKGVKSHSAGKNAGKLPSFSLIRIWLQWQTGAFRCQLCQIFFGICIAEIIVGKPEFLVRFLGCQGIEITDQVMGKFTPGEKKNTGAVVRWWLCKVLLSTGSVFPIIRQRSAIEQKIYNVCYLVPLGSPVCISWIGHHYRWCLLDSGLQFILMCTFRILLFQQVYKMYQLGYIVKGRGTWKKFICDPLISKEIPLADILFAKASAKESENSGA